VNRTPAIHPDQPGPGQESVWDYPRPPRVEPSHASIEIRFAGLTIARTTASFRVLETSHPPTYYLPRAAFAAEVLRPTSHTTFCEWKGRASYFDIVTPSKTASASAWTYLTPQGDFAALINHLAVMPGAMDECTLNGELVAPQEGGFYGGWITSQVRGPFKGQSGSWGW
jgi:uncharacterized protein (DUF427 family)